MWMLVEEGRGRSQAFLSWHGKSEFGPGRNHWALLPPSGCFRVKKIAAAQTLSQFSRFLTVSKYLNTLFLVIAHQKASEQLLSKLLTPCAWDSAVTCEVTLLHHGDSLWLSLGWHPQFLGFHVFLFLDFPPKFWWIIFSSCFLRKDACTVMFCGLVCQRTIFLCSHLTDSLAGYRSLSWIIFP